MSCLSLTSFAGGRAMEIESGPWPDTFDPSWTLGGEPAIDAVFQQLSKKECTSETGKRDIAVKISAGVCGTGMAAMPSSAQVP